MLLPQDGRVQHPAAMDYEDLPDFLVRLRANGRAWPLLSVCQ